jgi:predicted cupin superfamily sugar epimerase
MKISAQTYIDALELQAHPEGGFFKETYRSAARMDLELAPGGPAVHRNVCTGIYFLLERNNFSAFHRIKSDEMWHFYAGQALEVFEICGNEELICTRLGPDIANGEVLQHVVPAHTWFASRVAHGGAFSLVGCTVAPGFDFADFEMAERSALIAKYSQHARLIGELTR